MQIHVYGDDEDLEWLIDLTFLEFVILFYIQEGNASSPNFRLVKLS